MWGNFCVPPDALSAVLHPALYPRKVDLGKVHPLGLPALYL